MKKLLLIALFSGAFGFVDLNGMSFDEPLYANAHNNCEKYKKKGDHLYDGCLEGYLTAAIQGKFPENSRPTNEEAGKLARNIIKDNSIKKSSKLLQQMDELSKEYNKRTK